MDIRRIEFELVGGTNKIATLNLPNWEGLDKLIKSTPTRDSKGEILDGFEKGYVVFYEKEFKSFFAKHLNKDSKATVQDIIDYFIQGRGAIQQYQIASKLVDKIRESLDKAFGDSFRTVD